MCLFSLLGAVAGMRKAKRGETRRNVYETTHKHIRISIFKGPILEKVRFPFFFDCKAGLGAR